MIHCRVVTPEGLAKELDTTILNVVSTVGQLGILSRHVPLVTPLAISRMITEESDGRKEYAVAGGLLFALLRLLAASRVGFEFDLTLMEPFMIAFFTTIGLGASVALLRRGGRAAFRLLLAACLLLVMQNAAAIMIGKLSGLDPLLSVLAGSATMTGGHGTGLVFADEFEKVLGLQGAQAAAIACATFGVLAGSLLGGPIAERLIKGRSLANEANIGENYRKEMIPDVFSFGDTGEEINTHSILMAVFQITFAVGLGMWFSEWLGARGILLPAYAIALVAGMAIRNAGDHARLLRVNPRIVKHISGALLFSRLRADVRRPDGAGRPGRPSDIHPCRSGCPDDTLCLLCDFPPYRRRLSGGRHHGGTCRFRPWRDS